MAGRVIDIDQARAGEILPVEYLALVDSNKPRETSAAIQAVYLDGRHHAGEVAKFHDTTMGEPERKSDTDILSDVDKRILKTLGVDADDPVYAKHGLLSHLRDEVKDMIESTPGQSKQYSKYLYNLEKRLAKKSEETMDVSDVTGRMSKRERGVKASQMAIESHTYPAEKATKFRKEVLATSLFPNLYNRKTLLRSM
jgi:hypothetical protein